MSDKDDKDIQYRLKPDVIVEQRNSLVTFSHGGKALLLSCADFQDLFSVFVEASSTEGEASDAAIITKKRKRAESPR